MVGVRLVMLIAGADGIIVNIVVIVYINCWWW